MNEKTLAIIQTERIVALGHAHNSLIIAEVEVIGDSSASTRVNIKRDGNGNPLIRGVIDWQASSSVGGFLSASDTRLVLETYGDGSGIIRSDAQGGRVPDKNFNWEGFKPLAVGSEASIQDIWQNSFVPSAEYVRQRNINYDLIPERSNIIYDENGMPSIGNSNTGFYLTARAAGFHVSSLGSGDSVAPGFIHVPNPPEGSVFYNVMSINAERATDYIEGGIVDAYDYIEGGIADIYDYIKGGM